MSAMLKRCAATSADGRRCLRPEHVASVKHLVAPRGRADVETFTKIATAWGHPPKAADAAARGAQAGGETSAERFAQAVEEFCKALAEARRRPL